MRKVTPTIPTVLHHSTDTTNRISKLSYSESWHCCSCTLKNCLIGQLSTVIFLLYTAISEKLIKVWDLSKQKTVTGSKEHLSFPVKFW